MEQQFLQMLDYRLHINDETYANYVEYLDLQMEASTASSASTDMFDEEFDSDTDWTTLTFLYSSTIKLILTPTHKPTKKRRTTQVFNN